MDQSPGKLDGVFEGGGVKGIALIGAASVVEEAGYHFENLAGTSAGAIVATLLAAGYSAAALKPILMGIDFKQFMDASFVGRIPVVGQFLSILKNLGMYDGDYFLNLIRRLLSEKLKKEKVTFRDLLVSHETEDRYRFKVHVVASDVSRGRMLVLPGDIRAYGMEPEDLEVALAVRMSMSIPYFFKPVTFQTPAGETCYIVDGGLLSNFPIELFDTPPPATPAWPTFGYCLVPHAPSQGPTDPVVNHVKSPISLLSAMFNTTMEAHDAHYMDTPDVAARTIKIDSLGISATNFDLTEQQKTNLFESGRACAREFLSTWNFEDYKAKYRTPEAVMQHRTIRTHSRK